MSFHMQKQHGVDMTFLLCAIVTYHLYTHCIYDHGVLSRKCKTLTTCVIFVTCDVMSRPRMPKPITYL